MSTNIRNYCFLFFIFFVPLTFMNTNRAIAGEANLAWDSVEGATGYRIDYGTSSGNYSYTVDAGNNTTATANNLIEGQRYYFAAKAYSATQISGYSNEVNTLIPIPVPDPPIASFTTNKTSGDVPLTVTLIDTSTGSITDRLWNLGDGTTATSTTVVKTYTVPDIAYGVSLLVTGPGGNNTSPTTTITTLPIVIEPPTFDIPMETGQIASINNEWQRIDFVKSFNDPIVIANPISNNDPAPATVRIKDIDINGFSVMVQEWDYLDGNHGNETLSYMVIERGHYQLPDGTQVEAGRIETKATGKVELFQFDEPFVDIPMMFTVITTYKGASAVESHVKNVNINNFYIGMQEQEANKPKHTIESIDYIAWEPSIGLINGQNYEVGSIYKDVTHVPKTILYQNDAFVQPPLFFANMQTVNGRDTANVRYDELNDTSVNVWISEEQSKDDETKHTRETVGYMVIDNEK